MDQFCVRSRLIRTPQPVMSTSFPGLFPFEGCAYLRARFLIHHSGIRMVGTECIRSILFILPLGAERMEWHSVHSGIGMRNRKTRAFYILAILIPAVLKWRIVNKKTRPKLISWTQTPFPFNVFFFFQLFTIGYFELFVIIPWGFETAVVGSFQGHQERKERNK